MSVDSKINQKHNSFESKGAVDCMKYCYIEIWLKEYNVGNCCLITELLRGNWELQRQENYWSQLEVATGTVCNEYTIKRLWHFTELCCCTFHRGSISVAKENLHWIYFCCNCKDRTNLLPHVVCLATEWAIAWHSFGHKKQKVRLGKAFEGWHL